MADLEKTVPIVREFLPAKTGRAFSDGRIVKVLADLPRPLPSPLTAARLASQAGLSASRFAHLFRAQTGMPLRPYLRWLRLQHAFMEIAQGSNLTDAAHKAGFSDSAHFSRTCRKSFGIAPQVLRGSVMTLSSARPESANTFKRPDDFKF